MSAITRTDILDALRAAMQRPSPSGDGHTANELRASLGGVSHVKFRSLMMPLLQSGQVEVVRVGRVDMAGRQATVPGYRFTKKK